MAKYSLTTRNEYGDYETREHTDYTQTAAEGVASAAGWGIGMLLSLIFMSRITLGSTLIFISLFVMGASAGWGFFLMLTGAGFIAWWFHERSQVRTEEGRVLAEEFSLAQQAQRQARSLAESHSIPPTEPVVALATDEVELTRFWTKDGGKALLTNRRLLVDHKGGSVTVVRVPEITGASLSFEDEYNATVQLPTVANPGAQLEFSSRHLAQRVHHALRSAILGLEYVVSVAPDGAGQEQPHETTRPASQSSPSTSLSDLPATSASGWTVRTLGQVEIKGHPGTAAQKLSEVSGGSMLTLREHVEWKSRPMWIKVRDERSGTVGYVRGTSVKPL